MFKMLCKKLWVLKSWNKHTIGASVTLTIYAEYNKGVIHKPCGQFFGHL